VTLGARRIAKAVAEEGCKETLTVDAVERTLTPEVESVIVVPPAKVDREEVTVTEGFVVLTAVTIPEPLGVVPVKFTVSPTANPNVEVFTKICTGLVVVVSTVTETTAIVPVVLLVIIEPAGN